MHLQRTGISISRVGNSPEMPGDLFGYHPFHLWTVHPSCTSSDTSSTTPLALKSPSACAAFGLEAQRPSAHCTSLFPGLPGSQALQVFRDGIPIPRMVCRGSHWKTLKNATDLLPKTGGGGGRNHHCLISRCQA